MKVKLNSGEEFLKPRTKVHREILYNREFAKNSEYASVNVCNALISLSEKSLLEPWHGEFSSSDGAFDDDICTLFEIGKGKVGIQYISIRPTKILPNGRMYLGVYGNDIDAVKLIRSELEKEIKAEYRK